MKTNDTKPIFHAPYTMEYDQEEMEAHYEQNFVDTGEIITQQNPKHFQQKRPTYIQQNSNKSTTKFPQNPQQNPTKIATNLPQNPPHVSKDFWQDFVKNQQRYHAHFFTKCVANSDVFDENIPHILAEEIEKCLAEIAAFTKKKVRIHQVFYQPIVLYDDSGQYVYFAGTVIAEPIRGLLYFLGLRQ